MEAYSEIFGVSVQHNCVEMFADAIENILSAGCPLAPADLERLFAEP